MTEGSDRQSQQQSVCVSTQDNLIRIDDVDDVDNVDNNSIKIDDVDDVDNNSIKIDDVDDVDNNSIKIDMMIRLITFNYISDK